MERFEEFYRAYPRRVQRRAAEKAWLKAVKLKIDPQSMIDSAVRFASTKQGTEVKYIPYPATWLNAGAYDDEAEPKRVAGGSVRRGTYGG